MKPLNGKGFDDSTEIKRRPSQASESTTALVRHGELKFGEHDDFHCELRRRVDAYFDSSGQRPRDCAQMYLKTVIVTGWCMSSYLLLVFVVDTWWFALPLGISLGLSMAAIGFNVMHDGGHRAYSDFGWINRLMAMSLDLLGGSSYVWARKHNSIHHSYANIAGHDDDIDLGLLARLAPDQKRLKFHRLQQYYLWVLYGLMPLKWVIYDDLRDVIRGRVGGHRLARPKGWNLLIFGGGKVVFLSLVFGIPLLFHSIGAVLLFYMVVSFVQGVTLGVVFQLAHCVEEAGFPMPAKDTGRIDTTWAAHQIETTVDFARGNRVLCWLVGGLNFQIEHHLFPQICHIHYPALSRLVEEACQEFGLRYAAHDTFLAGVASHFRWLRRMGMSGA
jgi:linoleoyl-CoA desaturase